MSVQRLNRSQNWAVCLLGLVLLMAFAGLQAQAHPRKEAEIEITFKKEGLQKSDKKIVKVDTRLVI